MLPNIMTQELDLATRTSNVQKDQLSLKMRKSLPCSVIMKTSAGWLHFLDQSHQGKRENQNKATDDLECDSPTDEIAEALTLHLMNTGDMAPNPVKL